jgi:hypothetical protein
MDQSPRPTNWPSAIVGVVGLLCFTAICITLLIVIT